MNWWSAPGALTSLDPQVPSESDDVKTMMHRCAPKDCPAYFALSSVPAPLTEQSFVSDTHYHHWRFDSRCEPPGVVRVFDQWHRPVCVEMFDGSPLTLDAAVGCARMLARTRHPNGLAHPMIYIDDQCVWGRAFHLRGVYDFDATVERMRAHGDDLTPYRLEVRQGRYYAVSG